jgi:hypothetical protein
LNFSAEGLKHNGFVLRNYVTLRSYAEVVRRILAGGEAKAAAGRK